MTEEIHLMDVQGIVDPHVWTRGPESRSFTHDVLDLAEIVPVQSFFQCNDSRVMTEQVAHHQQ